MRNIVLLLFCFAFSEAIVKDFLTGNGKEHEVLTSFLTTLSATSVPLKNSVWSQMPIKDQNSCPTNLAKLIRVEDGCLNYVLANGTKAYHGTSKTALKATFEKSDDFNLLCVIRGSVDFFNIKAIENDCVLGLKDFAPFKEASEDVEFLLITWNKKLDIQDCPKVRRVKTLYDFLKLDAEDDFFLIHLCDSYLQSEDEEDFAKFEKLIKSDQTIVDPSLPRWDEECQETAQLIFSQLDSNDDNIINKEDIPKAMNPITSKYIYNKVRDLAEITFDMKVREAGALDFTIEKEEVEAMIVGLTQRDLKLWQQMKQEEASSKFEMKDEL